MKNRMVRYKVVISVSVVYPFDGVAAWELGLLPRPVSPERITAGVASQWKDPSLQFQV